MHLRKTVENPQASRYMQMQKGRTMCDPLQNMPEGYFFFFLRNQARRAVIMASSASARA